MKSNFDRAFEFTVGHEGGYSTDRQDPGNWTSGKVGQGTFKGTKYGIAANTYGNLDIKNLTLADAKAIYLRDFWRPMKCDDLPSGLDLVVWDAAVNSGGSRSAKWLQTACGDVQVDGLIGPGTLERVRERWAGDWEDLLEDTINLRWMFMQSLPTFSRYKNGWRNRILAIGKEAREWARETVVAQPQPQAPVPVPADPSSQTPPPELSDRDYDSIIDMLRKLAAALGLRLTSKDT